MVYLPRYIYHKNQPNVGTCTAHMDPMDMGNWTRDLLMNIFLGGTPRIVNFCNPLYNCPIMRSSDTK